MSEGMKDGKAGQAQATAKQCGCDTFAPTAYNTKLVTRCCWHVRKKQSDNQTNHRTVRGPNQKQKTISNIWKARHKKQHLCKSRSFKNRY